MSQRTGTFGIYRFHTLAELDAERARFVSETANANTQLSGASVNGQSFQFQVNGREMTLEEWSDAIVAAYNDRGIFTYGTPAPTRTVARFADGGASATFGNGCWQ